MSEQLQTIRSTLDVLYEAGDVVELRALGVPAGSGWTATFSGYFDTFDRLATEALKLDKRGARGVYVTANPVHPDLLARANNRVRRVGRNDPLTKNDEIIRRRWLLIDCDPARPAGISSTDEELNAAWERVQEIARFLDGEGWPGGLLASSGNGAHGMYRIDLPADDDGLCQRVLQALDARFTDDAIEVDTTVHNAARIWKLYGTTTRKGDPTEERPHRRARILRVADPLEVVPVERLQALAGATETSAPGGTGQASAAGSAPGSGHGGASDGLPVEEVRRALGYIPPRPDYGNWFRIAAAVYDAVGGDVETAAMLLQEWSPEEAAGEYRQILESGLNGSITTGTLIHEARQHGCEPPWKRNGHTRKNGRKRSSHHHGNGRAKNGAHGPVAVPLFGFKKPDPLRWKVAGLIPEGHVSMLAADGGTGKSFLAVYLSLCIALGRTFFGLGTRRGRVLFVDYELDAEEQQRRVWRVAEGMGLSVDDDKLTNRFFYYRPTAPLGTDGAHDAVMELIGKHNIDFVVLDSLTVGSAGSDVTASEDVVPVMQSLRGWGTVFAIDHVSGNAARGNQSRATPFGSVFKRNMARSTFTLAKADGGGYLLTPDKTNFTAKQDLVCYAAEFDGDGGPVRFSKVEYTDGRMAGSLSNMSSYDVTLTAIKELYGDAPVTPEEIVRWRDDHDVDPIKKGTAKNHFTVLNKRGKIDLDGGGAVPVGAGYHTPKPHHGDTETSTTNCDEKNPPHAAQTAKKAPSSRSSHHHTSYRGRDTVMSDGDTAPIHELPALHGPDGSGGDGATCEAAAEASTDWIQPGARAIHRLTGRTVEIISVRGHVVIVEGQPEGRFTVGPRDLRPPDAPATVHDLHPNGGAPF